MGGGSVQKGHMEQTWKARHGPPLETPQEFPHWTPPRLPRGTCPWNVIFTEEDTVCNPTTLRSKESSSQDSNPSVLSKDAAGVDTEEKEVCRPLSSPEIAERLFSPCPIPRVQSSLGTDDLHTS